METLVRDRRLRAFRAADAFALEAYRAAAIVRRSGHRTLVGEIRRSAIRSGGALVAASAEAAGGEDERRLLESARSGLIEGRYYLYLARRLGLLDRRRYRALTVRQDLVLKELECLLRANGSSERAPP